MCLGIETYGYYKVSEGAYGYVRYVCWDKCLQFGVYDNNHVSI